MTNHEQNAAKRQAMEQVRVVEEILRRWDPIGVLSVEGGPPDEYDGCAPHIVTLLNQGCSVEELTRYLETVRTKAIGLPRNLARDTEVALELIATLRYAKCLKQLQRTGEFLRFDGHRELASWTSHGIVDTSGANIGLPTES